jgi:hypothetical protein
MYILKFNKNEVDIIMEALNDNKEKYVNLKETLKGNYKDLPKNIKFIFKDEKSFDQYKNCTIQEYRKQIYQIEELEIKLYKILEGENFE